MIERDRDWIMERLVTRLYESLPPEENAEVEAYLNAHPDAAQHAAHYVQIAEGMRSLEREAQPFGDDEVQAMASTYRNQTRDSALRKSKNLTRWLITSAVAAAILALLVTQGLVVQVGAIRVALGNVPDLAPQQEAVTEDQLKQQVSNILEPYMDAVLVTSEQHTKEVETLYRLFRFMSQQRERDREELRNTFLRLTKEGVPGSDLVYAPLPAKGWEFDRMKDENQSKERVNN